jgi:hypothetical protein
MLVGLQSLKAYHLFIPQHLLNYYLKALGYKFIFRQMFRNTNRKTFYFPRSSTL